MSTCLCRDHEARTARLGDAARFVADASRRTDPTGTSSLRREMDMDLMRRWRALRNNITDAVEKSDLLHLRALTQAGMLGSLSSRPQYNHTIPHGDVVGGFETWLGTIMRQTTLEGNGDWTRPYVQRAVAQAKTRVHALTRQVPTVSQHRLMTLESSIITELRGVASAVAQQCSRVAAQAVLGRWRPARAAREMVRVVRDVGERRGAMMTDYAIVKAYNSGTLDALRNLGHRTVGVRAERVRVVQTAHGKALADARGVKGPGSRASKSKTPSASTIGRIEKVQEKLASLGEVDVLTAGDDDVCPECEDISDNGPYDIDEAESLIPAHVWCRCAFLPTENVSEDDVLDAIQDDFNEEDHPRDDHGKFESSGGSSKITDHPLMKAPLKGAIGERVALRKLMKQAFTSSDRKLIAQRVVASFVIAHGKAMQKGDHAKASEFAGKINKFAAAQKVDNPLSVKTTAEANKGYTPTEQKNAAAAMSTAAAGATGSKPTYTPEETKSYNDLAKISGSAASQYTAIAKASLAKNPTLALNMTPGEAAHIVAYTGSQYRETNSGLRAGVMDENRWNHVNELSRALQKLPDYRGTVYRKVGEEGFSRIAPLFRPGMIFEERGFMSTSKQTGVWSGEYHFEIQSLHGKNVEPLSAHKHEAEVLFDHGTRFRITSREGYRIKMQEVE